MELLLCSPKAQAWILLSHLSSDNQHVILLRVHEILEAGVSSSSLVFDCKEFGEQWHCPWFSSVIDDIAPVFRHVLKGNYYSSSQSNRGNILSWWEPREILDESLRIFLQDMEDMWLGAWKYLLLGKWPDCKYIDSMQKSLSEDEHGLLHLLVTKKCYVGGVTSESSSEFENILQFVFKRMLELSDNFDQVEYMNREPIIFVLDTEVQMLPWENLPILRDQEVYRMPSIGSIFATFDRYCSTSTVFPLIDPLDSIYVLNPGGDLGVTR